MRQARAWRLPARLAAVREMPWMTDYATATEAHDRMVARRSPAAGTVTPIARPAFMLKSPRGRRAPVPGESNAFRAMRWR
jgi:hypothetical protein